MKENKLLKELLVGNILCGIAVQIICILVTEDFFYYTVGLWCGIALSCFLCIHIRYSIEEEMELAPEDAEKHAYQTYMTRKVIAVVAIGIMLVLQLGSPVTFIIGISLLKLSVYIKLYVHKLISWQSRLSNRK